MRTGILNNLADFLNERSMQRKSLEELKDHVTVDPVVVATFNEVYGHIEKIVQQQNSVTQQLAELKRTLENVL